MPPDAMLSEDAGRAAELAAHMVAHLVEVSGVAGLNVTVTAAVLVAELLAELQMRTGDTPEALVAKSRLYISQRVACSQDEPAGARVLN